MGIHGSDTVYYTAIAESWADGRPRWFGRQEPLHREAVFALDALALRYFGRNDSSIKKLRAGADCLSMLLLSGLTFLLSGRRALPAIGAAALWAFLPRALYMARSELVHSLTATFVLLATTSLILSTRARNRGRWGWLVVSGLSAAIAARTHEEMFLLLPALFLAWLVGRQRRRPRAAVTLALLGLPMFAATGPIVAKGLVERILRLQLGTRPVGVAFDPEQVQSTIDSMPANLARMGWNGVVQNTSVAFALTLVVVVASVIAAWAHREVRRPRRWSAHHTRATLPLVVVLAFTASYSTVFTFSYSRVFLPLVPLLVVGVASWTSLLPFDRCRGWCGARSLSVCLLLVPLNFCGPWTQRDDPRHWLEATGPKRGLFDLDIQNGWDRLWWASWRTDWYRQRFEEMKELVTEESRLLVAPSPQFPWPGRRRFQLGFYFGNEALYLLDHSEPFRDLLVSRDVGVVLIAGRDLATDLLVADRFVISGPDGRWTHVPSNLGESVGLTRETYTPQLEADRIVCELERAEVSVLSRGGSFASNPEPWCGRTPSLGPEDWVIFTLQ